MLKWNAIYKRISMLDDSNLGAASVLNQTEDEGKRLSKWELCRVVKELRKFRRFKYALELLKYPETVAAPLDGQSSGYLVIQDEESETYSCFGLCKSRTFKELPFPQNKELTVQYVISSGQSTYSSLDPVLLIPLLNHPLSSNRYYAIVSHKKRKGEAFTCSREEDKTNCFFCRCVKDVKPKPLDPQNIYQQFEIARCEGLCSTRDQFFAKSIASDSYPPEFLRRKGWSIYTKTPDNFKLDSAQGLDSKLRARIPESISESHVVGKWYTTFVFVKDGSLKDQVKQSMYYEVTLEQRWEQIFSCRKYSNESQLGNSVIIDTLVEKEQVFVGGSKAVWNERSVVDGVVWFTTKGPGTGVGLRVELVERMKWEQERGGWVGGEEEKRVQVSRVEEIKGEWSEFGCYVLVERFYLKRMDASLVMSYDFKHLNHMKTKWE